MGNDSRRLRLGTNSKMVSPKNPFTGVPVLLRIFPCFPIPKHHLETGNVDACRYMERTMGDERTAMSGDAY